MLSQCLFLLPFPKRQILDSFKLKEFADDNFRFDENGKKFSKRGENTGRSRNYSSRAISASPSVFKRCVLQTRKNQDLFGKGLRLFKVRFFWEKVQSSYKELTFFSFHLNLPGISLAILWPISLSCLPKKFTYTI